MKNELQDPIINNKAAMIHLNPFGKQIKQRKVKIDQSRFYPSRGGGKS